MPAGSIMKNTKGHQYAPTTNAVFSNTLVKILREQAEQKCNEENCPN
jgi:hypothetical protein